MAPLAGAAGGSEQCGRAIYADQNDPDYAALRRIVEDAVQKARQFPRRDLEALLEWQQQQRRQFTSVTDYPTR